MDTGRTTLFMFAAAAAITVAARMGRDRQARLAAEADRIAMYVSAMNTGQQDLRREQLELKKGQHEIAGLVTRVETMTAELLQIGDQVMSSHHNQMRAVAGAYQALKGPDDAGTRRLRRIGGAG